MVKQIAVIALTAFFANVIMAKLNKMMNKGA